MRHGNQIEIKIPACCWQSWAGACGLDLRLEPVLLFLALQVYIWRPPEVKMRSAALSVTQLVRGLKTVFHSHPPLASLPHTHRDRGRGRGRTCPGWPDTSVLALIMHIPKQNPRWAALHSSPLPQSQGSDHSLLLWEVAVGRDERADATFSAFERGRGAPLHGLPSAWIHPSIRLALGCLNSSA